MEKAYPKRKVTHLHPVFASEEERQHNLQEVAKKVFFIMSQSADQAKTVN